mmetsp:Transcript_14532/g.29389  ORF Transcript_14532/g.29389 Transcript_14532/m.29389 type:complete len:94 (+) Transcript_14532:235-516(+)
MRTFALIILRSNVEAELGSGGEGSSSQSRQDKLRSSQPSRVHSHAVQVESTRTFDFRGSDSIVELFASSAVDLLCRRTFALLVFGSLQVLVIN